MRARSAGCGIWHLHHDRKPDLSDIPPPTGGPPRRRPPRLRRLYAVPTRSRWRTRIFGEPLGWGSEEDQLLPRRLALPVFASDTLSSVAYAAEAALVVLLAASLAAYRSIIPIALGVTVLMALVVLSYRRTIAAYPQGGGAFTVATANLGRVPGLIAAAALAVDYVLTATVSVAAAVFAITSAFPRLHPVRHEVAVLCVVALAVINLRGLRQTGRAVAVPVYGFFVMLVATIVWGVVQQTRGTLPDATVDTHLPVGVAASAGALVLLRAFASGCSALTGIEAVANGVGAFRHPQARNAWTTLAAMAGAVAALLLGVSWLAYETRALPSTTTSVLAQVGEAVWGTHGAGSVGYYALQLFTVSILLLAANTAYQGFPRLLASVAAAGSAPRWFQYMGDRLVLSNGVVALSVLAVVLLLAFDVRVDTLIHLYLVGVFLAFTLSQAGMVVHWTRRAGTPGALTGRIVNGAGALATGLVLLVIIAAKFTGGAWVVLLAIGALVVLAIVVGRHYRGVERAVLAETPDLPPATPGSVVVLVDVLDEHTASAARAGTVLAAGRGRRAVHVGSRDRWQALSHAWGREPSIELPLTPLASVYGDGPDAVAMHLRALADGDGAPLVAVLPRPRHALTFGSLRRRVFWRRVRRRLEREPMVAVAEMSHSISGGWWEADHVTGLVAMARPYAPARRALAFAQAFGGEATWAVHVAGSEQEAEAAEEWRHEVPAPLEVVESAYRDLGAPMLAAVHDVVSADTTTACLLVVPEVQVALRRFRWLHNQRTAILRRALADEDRTLVMTLPYPVNI
ncbi:MAG: APC family permease [Thermoleophilia bacterium]|nr:APC family permease [Thermoleophilia bacterium]